MNKEPLEIKTYLQPGSLGTIITLKRWADECWRFMNGKWQECVPIGSGQNIKNTFQEWDDFERKIGSNLL